MSSTENILLTIQTNPLGWAYEIPYTGIDSDQYFLLNESTQTFIVKSTSSLFGTVVWCDVAAHDESYYKTKKREKQITGKNVTGPFATLEIAQQANCSVFLSNRQFSVNHSIFRVKDIKPIGKPKASKKKLSSKLLTNIYQEDKVEFWTCLLLIAKHELSRL